MSADPYNFSWVGNVLSYTLPANTDGVDIKYSADGTTNWIQIYYTESSPNSQCPLSGTWSSPAFVKIVLIPNGGHKWSDPEIEPIVHVPV